MPDKIARTRYARTMANVFRPGTHPKWAVFASVYFLVLIALDIYWLFAERGPIGWLAD